MPRLEAAVTAELADLAMAAATVRVELVQDDGDPPTERAVLWLRANPGLPEAPLADVASGGELSRVLLALHGVAAAAEPDVTWVFDDVDSGVGGVTATAVAAKLGALAATRQVIVITHLPQVAALASYLWMISPELRDSRPVADTISAIKAGTGGLASQIDAYASVPLRRHPDPSADAGEKLRRVTQIPQAFIPSS